MTDQVPKQSFLLPRLGHLQNLANWPDADVIKTALVTEFIPEICKVPYDYLYRDDPVAMAECTLLVHEFLGLDLLIANTDCYDFEAEAMGAKINFFKKACPDFARDQYFIQEPEDLDKIKYPGLEAGRFPYLIEYQNACTKYTGVPMFPTFSAPWTLAGNLHGLDNLVMDTVDDPEFVHEFLNRLVDNFLIPMINDLNKVLPGMTELSLVDALVTIPMVNVDIVDEFIRPALERYIDGIDADVPLLDTAFFGASMLRGDDLKRFEDFIVWSNGRFFCSDPDVAVLTPEYARRRANDYGVPLQTGVEAYLVERGTKEQIIERVKHYVLAGKNGPTPCIFFFNNFTSHTPVENIQIAMQALSIYGAPGATAETPYVDPEFVTFEDFLRHKMDDNVEGYTFDWLEHSELKKDLL